MSIPADVILVWVALGLMWLACRKEEPEQPPPELLSVLPKGPALSNPMAVEWLKTCQQIALDRGDYQMADIYRDKANRLVAQQASDRLAYNQARRDRILKGSP